MVLFHLGGVVGSRGWSSFGCTDATNIELSQVAGVVLLAGTGDTTKTITIASTGGADHNRSAQHYPCD